MTMHMTVMKRIQSVLSLCAILIPTLQLIYQLFENLASVLVTSELVETRAGGRQQDGIAGVAVRERVHDR